MLLGECLKVEDGIKHTIAIVLNVECGSQGSTILQIEGRKFSMGIHKVVGRVDACFEQSLAIHGNGDAEYREEVVNDRYSSLDVIFVV